MALTANSLKLHTMSGGEYPESIIRGKAPPLQGAVICVWRSNVAGKQKLPKVHAHNGSNTAHLKG